MSTNFSKNPKHEIAQKSTRWMRKRSLCIAQAWRTEQWLFANLFAKALKNTLPPSADRMLLCIYQTTRFYIPGDSDLQTLRSFACNFLSWFDSPNGHRPPHHL